MAKPTKNTESSRNKRTTNKAGNSSKASRAKNSSKKGSGQQQRYASRSGYQYDRDRVAEEIIAITAYYSGSQPEKQGYRQRFRCPECGKEALDANSREQITGCWNPECAVPQSVGAVKFIAYFEQLDPDSELKLILQRGYEAAGIPPEAPISDAGNGGSAGEAANAADSQGTSHTSSNSPGSQQKTDTTAPAAGTALAEATDEGESQGDSQEAGEAQLDFNDRVYRTVMGWCRLEKHHTEYWVGRGLTPETISAARLGSISKRRARYVISQIQRHFSREELLTVPGFFINDSGNFMFTFYGEYTLIPYFDGRGRISTIEGRIYADKPPRGLGKYVSLRDSGSHVYLFPGTDPNDLVAICEGPVGAIAAAQEGVAVGAIQGFRRYHGKPRYQGDERPPPEIDGADFGQRMISYIPDVDDPPQPHVMDEAPKAARVLVALQNGKPAVTTLPSGKDLDEYLLAMNKAARRSSLLALLKRATPTAMTPGATTDDQTETQRETASEEQNAAEGQDGAEGRQTAGDDPDNLYPLFPRQGEDSEKSGPKNTKERRGKAKNKTAGSEDSQEPLHRELRPTPTPTPAEQDFYYWTGREQGRYKQSLPSGAPVTRDELVAGLYTGGVTLAALWLVIVLVSVAGGYLSMPGPAPRFLPAGAGQSLERWGAYASEPFYAGIALTVAAAVSAMVALAVISRLSGYRKDKRRMLLGEVKW